MARKGADLHGILRRPLAGDEGRKKRETARGTPITPARNRHNSGLFCNGAGLSCKRGKMPKQPLKAQ
jgi:hypothetical protein